MISQALLGFSALRAVWTKIRSGSLPFTALVANNSWGVVSPEDDLPERFTKNRFIDNPHHALNVEISKLARDGVDIVFAAGNCGYGAPEAQCGLVNGAPGPQRIMGANALPDVLTVAGCDTAGHRLEYSSQGPVIKGMPKSWPKPDVTAYAHFKGSGVWQNLDADPGTSAACAVASGCVAALRSKFPSPTTPPSEMIAAIRRSARAESPKRRTMRTSDYGMGIINVLAAEASLAAKPKKKKKS
jgi:subtilisin family serine protease